MTERNVVGGVMGTVSAIYVESIQSFTPYLMLAVVLICVDCRFGVQAARARNEAIRFSRMWRRSINKLVDYICWLGIAALFGQTFGKVVGGIPITAFGVLIIIYGIELGSCFNNYFEARGIKKEFNVLKFFRKGNIDFIEEKDKEKNNEKEDK